MTTAEGIRVCLCGAGSCNIPEAVALRERMAADAAKDRRINAIAFDLYLADRDAGRPTKTPAEYRKEVD